MQAIWEAYGFQPLDTASMERISVLMGREEAFGKSLYGTRLIRGTEDLTKPEEDLDSDALTAMRFDLTVSLARYVASLWPDRMKFPFKRWQIGKVWRGEKPQRGRMREFTQCDFDIIGASGMMADAEVLVLMEQILLALGVERFVIGFSNRRILNGLAEVLAVTEEWRIKRMLQIIDLAGADDHDKINAELQREDMTPQKADTTAVEFTDEQVRLVLDFLALEQTDDQIGAISEFFAGKTEVGKQGVDEIIRVEELIRGLGVPESRCRVMIGVVRGLDYYVGTVMETQLLDLPTLGSVFSGGRFDGLTNRFVRDSNIAGVGASLGLDRLEAAMQELGVLHLDQSSGTQVLVTAFDESVELASMLLAEELRSTGLSVETFLGDNRSFREQIGTANSAGIALVAILGPKEIGKGTVSLRNMKTREQTEVPRADIVAAVRRQLSE